ncbi:hypothetical protein [Hydrocarboniphaga sp.]|uniref:hypothetical protein n=1 Tax=Hydrocarboniphaga sp. TaxID=2033016 RepID=UPI003D11EBDB
MGELARLQVGSWGPEAVRKWIAEEPPCPIAQPALNGAPHRYQIEDVLAWLRLRGQRELAKGFVPADGVSLVDRVDQALKIRARPPGGADTQNAQGDAEPQSLFDQPAAAEPATRVSPAKPERMTPTEIEGCTDVEMLLNIIMDRVAPQDWRATEQALAARTERLVAEGKLVPVADLRRAVEAIVMLVRAALEQLGPLIASRISDGATYNERLAAGQRVGNELLERLANKPIQGAGNG